jgi:hypothetical protein
VYVFVLPGSAECCGSAICCGSAYHSRHCMWYSSTATLEQDSTPYYNIARVHAPTRSEREDCK